jgi:DNA-binding protein Fis
MKGPFPHTQMSALAYLYDHVRELPGWFHRLTARQLQDVADLMVQWNVVSDNKSMLTMEQIEKREVLRVLAMCDGNIGKAANVLKMGKTTIYRKLVQWGYSVQNRILIENASASSRESEAQAKRSQSE